MRNGVRQVTAAEVIASGNPQFQRTQGPEGQGRIIQSMTRNRLADTSHQEKPERIYSLLP
jgi:hypothetical protein